MKSEKDVKEETNVWIETFSGKKFDPINPKVEDINIIDIAHALSQICRYAGHTPKFYSVAQHSVMVALVSPWEHRLWGLLHDAAEAYIADIPRPVKQHLPKYRELEENILIKVAERFGLEYPIPEEVLVVDSQMLKIEHRDVMNSQLEWTCDKLDDIPLKIPVTLAPEQAKAQFLAAWEFLRKEVGPY